MIRTLIHFIQDRMPNRRPPPHPCVNPDLGGVGHLRKCKSSILSGLPQASGCLVGAELLPRFSRLRCGLQLMTFPAIFLIDQNRDLFLAVVDCKCNGTERAFVLQDPEELKRTNPYDRDVC